MRISDISVMCCNISAEITEFQGAGLEILQIDMLSSNIHIFLLAEQINDNSHISHSYLFTDDHI
jgi:hypothetical protein